MSYVRSSTRSRKSFAVTCDKVMEQPVGSRQAGGDKGTVQGRGYRAFMAAIEWNGEWCDALPDRHGDMVDAMDSPFKFHGSTLHCLPGKGRK
jgi:hypothetical protein